MLKARYIKCMAGYLIKTDTIVSSSHRGPAESKISSIVVLPLLSTHLK